MRYNENSCIHKRRIETVELHKVTNRKLLMQHRLWTPDVFSHSTWFHHFSPTERLLSQLHHQTLTFPRRAEIFTVWRASLLPTFNHRSRQKRRREDKYSSSFWLTLFSLPVSHQHVLCFSLVSCLTECVSMPWTTSFELDRKWGHVIDVGWISFIGGATTRSTYDRRNDAEQL